MKNQFIKLFSQMCPEQLESLTNIVKETLATGINQPIIKVFTAADLWNIRRMGKKKVQRRTFA